jgi:hypothetical protein
MDKNAIATRRLIEYISLLREDAEEKTKPGLGGGVVMTKATPFGKVTKKRGPTDITKVKNVALRPLFSDAAGGGDFVSAYVTTMPAPAYAKGSFKDAEYAITQVRLGDAKGFIVREDWNDADEPPKKMHERIVKWVDGGGHEKAWKELVKNVLDVETIKSLSGEQQKGLHNTVNAMKQANVKTGLSADVEDQLTTEFGSKEKLSGGETLPSYSGRAQPRGEKERERDKAFVSSLNAPKQSPFK